MGGLCAHRHTALCDNRIVNVFRSVPPPPAKVPSYPGMLSNIPAGGALGAGASAVGGANIAASNQKNQFSHFSRM